MFSSVGKANSSSSCAVVSARRLGVGGLSKIMIKKRICASIAAVKGSGGAPGVKNTVAEIVRRTRAEQLGRANREVPDLSA